MVLHMHYQQNNTTVTKQILVHTYALLPLSLRQILVNALLMSQYCSLLDKYWLMHC